MKEEVSFQTKMLRLVNKLQLKYGLPAPPRQTSADNLIHPESSCIWENVLSFTDCLKENVATMSSLDQLTFKSRVRIRNIPIFYYPSKSSNTWAHRRTYSKSGQLNQPSGQALTFNKSTSSTDTDESGSVSSSTNTNESGSVRSSSYDEIEAQNGYKEGHNSYNVADESGSNCSSSNDEVYDLDNVCGDENIVPSNSGNVVESCRCSSMVTEEQESDNLTYDEVLEAQKGCNEVTAPSKSCLDSNDGACALGTVDSDDSNVTNTQSMEDDVFFQTGFEGSALEEEKSFYESTEFDTGPCGLELEEQDGYGLESYECYDLGPSSAYCGYDEFTPCYSYYDDACEDMDYGEECKREYRRSK